MTEFNIFPCLISKNNIIKIFTVVAEKSNTKGLNFENFLTAIVLIAGLINLDNIDYKYSDEFNRVLFLLQQILESNGMKNITHKLGSSK